ncbi:MAG TPA: c-type cytochrome [Burkholderiaceae bacterium]|nr:c-type cytochrome [Burkholderiaceae bacterium]
MSLRYSVAVLSFMMLVFATGAPAQTTGADLAKARNCLACHQIDAKRVGPSFKLIVERYAGQPSAQEYLAGTIRSGGRARWGAVPMPAQPHVSPEDARAIADWILSLAP